MKRSILLLMLVCVGCGKPIMRDEIAGTYVFIHDEFTKDTLRVFMRSTYQKRVYSTRTRDLLYQQRDKWKLFDDFIIFDNFMLNEHADFDSHGSFYEIRSGLHVKRTITRVIRIEEGENEVGVECYYTKLE